jgi:hypothetical protein
MADTTTYGTGAVQVRVTGLEKATELLRDTQQGAAAVGRTRARIGSDLPYAHWINEGFYRSGRPGRRVAGPARFMEAGLERIRALLPAAIARNLERGPQTVERAISGVLGEGTKAAKAKTPVVSGNLRASLHTAGALR